MPKKPPCTTCGSTRYRKNDQGFFVCEYGHQLIGYLQEEGDFDHQGLGSNRVIGQFTKASLKKEKNKRLVGQRAKFVFCKAVQVLMKQILSVLIEEKRFPLEYEETVQKLWLLLVSKWGVECYEEAEGAEDTLYGKDETQEDTFIEEPLGRETPEMILEDDDDEIKIDAGYDWLLDERFCLESLYGLFQYAAQLHRLPVVVEDWRCWIRNEQLPFFRAMDCLPPEVPTLLDFNDLDFFRRNKEFQIVDFKSSLRALDLFFEEVYELRLPCINHDAFIVRFTNDLLLPGSFASMLKDFIFEVVRIKETTYPDILVYALVLVKLIYGLDHIKRELPVSLGLKPLNEWIVDLYNKVETSGIPKSYDRYYEYGKDHIRELSEFAAKVKQFPSLNVSKVRQPKLDIVHKTLNEVIHERNRTAFNSLLPHQPIDLNETETLPCGQHYTISYLHWANDFLPGTFKLVLEYCAGLIGVSADEFYTRFKRIEMHVAVDIEMYRWAQGWDKQVHDAFDRPQPEYRPGFNRKKFE